MHGLQMLEYELPCNRFVEYRASSDQLVSCFNLKYHYVLFKAMNVHDMNDILQIFQRWQVTESVGMNIFNDIKAEESKKKDIQYVSNDSNTYTVMFINTKA